MFLPAFRSFHGGRFCCLATRSTKARARFSKVVGDTSFGSDRKELRNLLTFRPLRDDVCALTVFFRCASACCAMHRHGEVAIFSLYLYFMAV